MIDGIDLETLQYKKIQLNKANADETITLAELTRWYLLDEAITLAEQEAAEHGKSLDFNNLVTKQKAHKALNKYIDERYFACMRDLIIDNKISIVRKA